MRAKVTEAFNGVPDGRIHPRQIAVGEIIDGDLAAVAVREKWADELKQEAESENPSALDDMTVAKLKAFAEEHEIDIGDATKKDDIRAAIDLALEGRQ
jgi:hypothetical protein